MSGERSPPSGKLREELDRRLITVAREILEREGLEALTLRAAARGAGVSHMAPYRHFESKDELLAAVAEEGFELLVKAMNGAGSKANGRQAELESLGHAYVKFAMANPALYRLMFGANLPNRGRFPGLVEAGNAALQRCAEVLGPDGQGDVGDKCGPRRAIAFWAFVHGIACLAIDDLITLPEKGDGALAKEVGALFKSIRTTAEI
jgi:AcrR family transcriptional regulator